MTLTEQDRSTAARLVGVDAARGAALIGMMAVHISPRLGADGGVTAEYLIASGRASALFAVLAGVGLALASGGANPPRGAAWKGVAAGTAARAGVLLLVGFLLGESASGVAVILVYYALLFVVGIPFLSLGPRVLLPLAVVWAAVTPVISQFARLGDTWQSPGNPILASLADPVGLATDLFLTGYYPVLQWTAYLLLGLGLGRLDLHRLSSQAAVLVGGAALGATAWATSWLLLENGGLAELRAAGTGSHPMADGTLDAALQPGLYGTTPTTSWWWLAVAAPHSGTPFDMWHTMGSAAAVLGLMLLLARHLGVVLRPLGAIGSMTLTLYTLHVVLLGTALPRATPDALLWHVVIAFAIAVPWRTFVGRGPLESVATSASRSARTAALSPAAPR